MKATGIIRNVDDLGRIVIPMELRKALDINVKSDLWAISLEGDRIILEKVGDRCAFCGSREELVPFKGKCICARCKGELLGE